MSSTANNQNYSIKDNNQLHEDNYDSRTSSHSSLSMIRINVSDDEVTIVGNSGNYDGNIIRGGLRVSSYHYGWLKFDFNNVPKNTTIISATLNVFAAFASTGGDYPIGTYYSSDDTWKESTISGTNHPEFNANPTDVNNGSFYSNRWYKWNVTNDVSLELKKNRILTEMLKYIDDVNFPDVGFAEKEYDISKSAFIEIKYQNFFNSNFNLEDGDGNGTLIYVGKKDYSFSAKVMTLAGKDLIDKIEFYIDPLNLNLQYRWTRASVLFEEISDPEDYTDLIEGTANFNDNTWEIQFTIFFNLNYPHEDLTLCKLVSYTNSGSSDTDFYYNIFRVENNLDLTGTLQVISKNQGHLTENKWVREGEMITWAGLKIVYEDTTNVYPQANVCKIKLTDTNLNTWETLVKEEGIFDLTIPASAVSNSEQYNIYTISIVPSSNDISIIPSFRISIDSMDPGKPLNFVTKADSQSESEAREDNDDTIFLSWSSSVETGSGIMGYYYGEAGTTPAFTTDTKGQISGLDEGIHNFEVYAEDNVGNSGEKNTASIIIDMTSPLFSGFLPEEDKWINKTPVIYSISISDIEGSGIDTGTIEYSILKSGSDEWGSWQIPESIINNDNNSIVIVQKQLILPEGKDNYVKWRVLDLAGNGPIESEVYKIMVDTKPVLFSDFSPTNSEKRNITINLTLKDTSGILSFEYRIKLSGESEYGSWEIIDINGFDLIKTFSIPLELPYGNAHKIQFRAEDIAKNGITLSDEYQIKINSKPKVVIVSPDPEVTYKTSDLILFDTSGTTDKDNDVLKYWWESDITGELRRTAVFSIPLTYGTHKITLRVTDEGGHIVNVSFDLEVLPVDTDGDGIDDSEDDDDDGDGMPDYWEYMNGLNPLKNDAQDDKDGDGYTNKEEYNAGTDPSDKNSKPKGLSSSMVSTIVILVVVMLIIIIAMGIGFILYRRNLKKRLIVPEVVSKPGVPSGAALPGSVPSADALPGTAPSTLNGVALPGPAPSTQQPQYLLPEHKMSPEEILYQLDQRFVLGEIPFETYNELKMKYEQSPVQGGTVLKKKKIKKIIEVSPPPQEQENDK
jgi:hypothetical protein